MKFLPEIILYIILFSREYKKQTKEKNNPALAHSSFCSRFTKNAYKYVLFFMLILFPFLNVNSSFAYCAAQSACKVTDLQTEQNKKIEQAINDYFSIKMTALNFFDYKNISYNDLFIYHTIV